MFLGSKRALVLGLAAVFAASIALAGTPHTARQTRPISLGTSGGNVKDKTTQYCCSGTLGALVASGSTQYILSNNHVLARANMGVAGEAINQPGLVDVNCAVKSADYVANLTRWVSIVFSRTANNKVDGAIAKVISGNVKTGGDILEVGQVASSVLNSPPVNTSVKKSGRTTGLTTGKVTGLNGTVTVAYSASCGGASNKYARYVGQIIFSNISSGGDSGSLIEENKSSCPRPIALLFAGSSSQTIGNPMSDVLSQLGVSMVHGSCASPDFTQENTDLSVQHAIDVQNRVTDRLMNIPGVVGTSIGADDTGRPVLQVYLEKDDAAVRGQIPAQIEDLASRIEVSGPFVAQ